MTEMKPQIVMVCDKCGSPCDIDTENKNWRSYKRCKCGGMAVPKVLGDYEMTDKTKPLSVRLPNETIEEIEKRLKKDGKTLRDLLTEYALGENLAEIPSVNTDLAEIESMMPFFHITLEEFIPLLCSAMTEGQITVEEGEIKTRDSLDMDDFYDACHEAGVDPQKAVNKMTGMIRHGN